MTPSAQNDWMSRFEPILKISDFWRFSRSRTAPNNGDIRFSAPKSCLAQFFSHKNLTTSTTSREDYGFPGPSKVRFLAFKVVVQEKSAKIDPWVLCSKSGFSKGKMRYKKSFHGQSVYEKHEFSTENSISPLFGFESGLFWTVKKIFLDQKFFLIKSLTNPQWNLRPTTFPPPQATPKCPKLP